MGIVIGMDEAGYGPNLGPLVVAATVWEVSEEAGSREQGAGSEEEDGEFAAAGGVSLASAARPNLAGLGTTRLAKSVAGLGTTRLAKSVAGSGTTRLAESIEGTTRLADEIDLYRLLCDVVAKSPSERRVVIADSKALYHPGNGLRQLERGVHAVLGALGRAAPCWSALVEECDADPHGHHHCLPWHDTFDCVLPIDASADELAPLGARLANTCETAGVRPLAIRARLVFPAQFNELIEYHGSKGAALSHVTVGLLREMTDAMSAQPHSKKGTGTDRQTCSRTQRLISVGASPLFVVCDKHGGRNFYGALLQHHFPEHWIEPVFESRAESRYEWGLAESRVQVSFRTKGEAFLPTALASMTAKYLRELAMRAFNEFWCARVPGLRPTAGYPLDARRFKTEIAAAQRELGIDDHVLWRKR